MQVGDLVDMHSYVGPNAPVPTATRAAVLGEFGGLGLRLEGHLWIPEDAFCYEMMASPAALEVPALFVSTEMQQAISMSGHCQNSAIIALLKDFHANPLAVLLVVAAQTCMKAPWIL